MRRAGYFEEEEDPVGTFVRPLFACEGLPDSRIDDLCWEITTILEAKRQGAVKKEGPKTLDQVSSFLEAVLICRG